MTTDVTDITSLNAAIVAADTAAANSGVITIQLDNSITLTTVLEAVNLAAGVTLDIVGQGHTIDGGGTQQGLFVYAGTVDVSNLTIADAVAVGGAGGSGLSGGGGGAGLGGGLFVAGPTQGSGGGNVTLINVGFSNDGAVGGAGGAQTIYGPLYSFGIGGGGGLGGNGGSASQLTSAGGGGGIGSGAAGGSSAGAGGGAGKIPGAAAGGAGASGGAGGASGGGGGGGDGYGNTGYSIFGGGGGGVGGTPGNASNYTSGFGGNGGFGGGGGGGGGTTGGGGGLAGQGGFGGGGGGAGGNGGFGGGGGGGGYSSGGGGGFGGGRGGTGLPYNTLQSGGGGGGGLGAGGDIFVQQGGILTIEGGTLADGTVTGGAGGGSIVGHDGADGSAYGSGLFIQGNQAVTLAPAAGQTLTIAGAIADQDGSYTSLGQSVPAGTSADGTPYAGIGTLVVAGGGTVALTNAQNTYSGGTTIEAASTLLLGAPGAAGYGAISFAPGTADDLTIGRGDSPANSIAGFAAGDVIDLQGIGLAGTATVNAAGTLMLSGGGLAASVTLELSPSPTLSSLAFALSGDGAGGTEITGKIGPGPTLVAAAPAKLGHGQSAIIGTVSVPGLPSDALSLHVINAPSDGRLSLAGGKITYTETKALATSTTDSFSYDIVDQYGKTSAVANAAIVLDAGPITSTVTATVDVGSTTNLAATILAGVKSGLAGDTETITAIGSSSPNGSETLAAGAVDFTATGGSLQNIAAEGTASVSFGYTITDQLGDTAGGTVVVKVVNPVDRIYGGIYGGSTINGTTGADIITAYQYNNVINDNGGNDTVYAGLGQATVNAGSGNDLIDLNGYYDAVAGATGNDTISGALGNATITLGNGSDVVSLAGYNNIVHAGTTSGTDYIDAGVGSSTITGGGGNFVVLAGGFNNVVSLAGGGNNAVFTTPSNNPSLPSGTPVPVDQGAATVTTGSGNDTIIAGGYGNVINAGAGMNYITGGTGKDIFILDNPGFDTITNFSLTNNDVLNVAAALTAAGWTSSKTLANYLKITDTSSYATLSIVPGGTGPATAIAQLNNVGSITLASLQSHMVL
jgi:Ca2+-binding RTX toxin-like protein